MWVGEFMSLCMTSLGEGEFVSECEGEFVEGRNRGWVRGEVGGRVRGWVRGEVPSAEKKQVRTDFVHTLGSLCE